MISELDIWRAAQQVINRHGADALSVAAQCADELFMEDDLEGAAAWRRILHAVAELQRAGPRKDEAVH
jgi:hypothetical protein